MNYIDCQSEIEVIKTQNKWENDEVEFWKSDDYGWCSRRKGDSWNYGYATLKDAIIKYTMTLAHVDPSIHTTSSMLIDNSYDQANAWNKNEKDKKVSSINCKVVVRRFTA